MRTTLLTPEIFSAEGGLARILRLYLKALCEVAGPKDQVRLVTLIDPTIDSSDLDKYANEQLFDWEACGRGKLRFLRATLRQARNSDLLICGHVGQLPVAWFCRLRYPKLRYVLIAHGLEVWRPFSWIERKALQGAWRLWCVSDYTRREILRHSGVDPSKAEILLNALDPFLEAPNHSEPSRGLGPIVLTISRLTWSDRYKGIDHLIQALPRIRERVPDACLRIIGRGDDLPRLQKLAAEHTPNGAVQFLGYLSDEAVKKELCACRVFALPSEREGFGLVFLEAMTQGKPCVAANAGGAPEVITPETGLLCPFGNVKALAEMVGHALTASWDVAAIQARARAFSYSVFRDRLSALLNG